MRVVLMVMQELELEIEQHIKTCPPPRPYRRTIYLQYQQLRAAADMTDVVLTRLNEFDTAS